MRAPRRRSLRQPGVAALSVIAAGTLISVAACATGVSHGRSATPGYTAGTARAVSGGRAAQPGMCLAMPELTTVRARMTTTALHEVEPAQVLYGGVIVRARSLVRDLAAALCSLPLAPRTLVNCPPQLGGLQLAFTAGSRRFPPVTVEMHGCRVVKGLGRSRAPTPALWRALSAAVGGRWTPSSSGGGINPGAARAGPGHR